MSYIAHPLRLLPHCMPARSALGHAVPSHPRPTPMCKRERFKSFLEGKQPRSLWAGKVDVPLCPAHLHSPHKLWAPSTHTSSARQQRTVTKEPLSLVTQGACHMGSGRGAACLKLPPANPPAHPAALCPTTSLTNPAKTPSNLT